MPSAAIEHVGRNVLNSIEEFGKFWRFNGRVFIWLWTGMGRKTLRNMPPLMHEIGVKSLPVVAITGAFIGMVLAIEMYNQFRSIGQENRLGSIIGVSVVKQIGPVLAAVMLAGRVGGALTAELGTMNVTEQLDALRVMGSDPIRHLVVPRFLACMLLTPILTIYSDILGVMGGYLVAVHGLGVPEGPYWQYAQQGVGSWAILEGITKGFFFGGAIGMISCYKGFTCGAGASGVGRACTESFVYSFIAIIVFNFFFARVASQWYIALYGVQSLFG